jgi:S-(hydroxymethyl)glutathione dehydrogenase/alcohol dehydrogenase
MCHSDHHLLDGGYPDIRRPIVPGHEGAGVVEVVGPGVVGIQPGDHVVLAVPLPPCGRCVACLDAMPHLCERGALIGQGFQIADGTARHHAGSQDLSLFVFLGTFSHHTVVHEESCVVVDSSFPPEVACTIACSGVTGWGAVLNTAGVRAGQIVVIVGVGGIGANSLLAARFAGASAVVAIDPVPAKRELAIQLGATAATADLEEANGVVSNLTSGRMAHHVIMAMSTGDGRDLEAALSLVGKQGRVIVVNVHRADEMSATVSLRTLQSLEKQVVGCLAGSWDGRKGIAFLTRLWKAGLYDPSVIVSRVYDGLSELSRGYQDQADGNILRGVIRLG